MKTNSNQRPSRRGGSGIGYWERLCKCCKVTTITSGTVCKACIERAVKAVTRGRLKDTAATDYYPQAKP